MLVKRGLMNINTFSPFHPLLRCHCVCVFFSSINTLKQWQSVVLLIIFFHFRSIFRWKHPSFRISSSKWEATEKKNCRMIHLHHFTCSLDRLHKVKDRAKSNDITLNVKVKCKCTAHGEATATNSTRFQFPCGILIKISASKAQADESRLARAHEKKKRYC